MTTANIANKPLQGTALMLVGISLSLATFMNVLDSSIANVAIPSITSSFGSSPYQGTWIITAFGTSMAIMLPLSGWLTNRFGAVRLFVGATIAFTFFSLLCGLSISFSMLVGFRIIQGIAAGIMLPLSQSLLLISYPEEKQGLATAIWSVSAMLGPLCGPVLGGWITENWHWPWIFYINLPVGIFSTYLTWHLLSKYETPIQKVPIDAVGLFLLVVGVGCLQIFLDKGQELDWFHSTTICTLAIISIVSLSFLTLWELTDNHPVIDFRLFKSRNFTIGTIAASLGFLVLFSNVVILPLWLQTQMGYTSMLAGLAAAPIGILTLVFAPIIGQSLHKIDLRLITSAGFIIFSLCSFWNAQLNTQAQIFDIVLPRFIQGAGVSCFMIPLYSIVLSGLPKNQTTSALGLATFFRLLGGNFGTSFGLTLWKRREAFHHSQLTENITAFNPNSVEIFHKMHTLGMDNNFIFANLNNTITQQTFMLATNDYYWLSGIVFFSLVFLVWLAKPPFKTNNSAQIE